MAVRLAYSETKKRIQRTKALIRVIEKYGDLGSEAEEGEEDSEGSGENEEEPEKPEKKRRVKKATSLWDIIPDDDTEREELLSASKTDVDRYVQLQDYLARWPVALYDLSEYLSIIIIIWYNNNNNNNYLRLRKN